MAEIVLLSPAQMERIRLFFPLSHGVASVEDRRVVSGIVFVIRNGLRWRDAPPAYGPHKTLYNRFIRWSRLGVFDRIFAGFAGQAGEPDRLMIDSTHLKTLYRQPQRHRIENAFGRLKDWRRVTTRYDRCAHTCFSAICIAATAVFWLGG